jgi:hypothetical protein
MRKEIKIEDTKTQINTETLNYFMESSKNIWLNGVPGDTIDPFEIAIRV